MRGFQGLIPKWRWAGILILTLLSGVNNWMTATAHKPNLTHFNFRAMTDFFYYSGILFWILIISIALIVVRLWWVKTKNKSNP